MKNIRIGQGFDVHQLVAGRDLIIGGVTIPYEKGVMNIDATIIAQAPKMAPHIPAMITNIAQDLNMPAGDINIKAKTAEKLGYIGRGEGIVAEVVCLIAKTDNIRG